MAIAWPCLLSASTARNLSPSTSKLENRVIYSVDAPGHLYLVQGGQRHLIADPAWIPRHGYTWNQVKAVPKAEFSLLPSGADVRPVAVESLEGSLIKAGNQSAIFYVRGGLKHWIMNPNWLGAHKRLAAHLKIVSPETVDAIPAGAPFTYTPKRDVWLTAVAAFLVFCFLILLVKFPSRIRQLTVSECNHKDYLFRKVLFAVLVACVLVRSLHLLAHPRFWAEEGVVWFQFAVTHSAWSTLGFVYPLSGYMNLAANVAAVLSGAAARAGHIFYAPLASTALALGIHVIPLAIICLGNSRLFNSPWKLIIGGLIILILPSTTPEIWLNSINSMSFTGLITLLLLFEENVNWRPAVRWAIRALLAFCGLTGIYAVVLAPFFLACYLYRRSREYLIQGLILLGAGVIQAASVIYFKLHGGLPMRGQGVASLASINALYYHVATPFVGQVFARPIFRFFGIEDAWWVANSYPHWPDESTLLAGWVSAAFIVAILICLCRRKFTFDKLLLAAIFVMYSTVTALGSLHGIAAARYAFLPEATILLLVFLNLDGPSYGLKEVACAAAIAIALSVGVVEFYNMDMFSGPSWSDEVAKWEENHNYGLKVWPGGWGLPIYYYPTKQ